MTKYCLRCHHILWITLLLLSCSKHISAQTQIKINPGHQEVITMPDVIRVAIGDPQIADVQAIAATHQVIITGHSTGSTNLILWTKAGRKATYNIVVTRSNRSLLTEIQQSLTGIEGLQAMMVSGKITIDGILYRPKDYTKLNRILKQYPQVRSLVRFSPQAQNYLMDKIQTALNKAQIQNVYARADGDNIALEGEVNSSDEQERVERVAKSFFSDIIIRLTQKIPSQQLILVDIKFLEVQKNSLNRVGITWPSQVSGQGNVQIMGSRLHPGAVIGHEGQLTLDMLTQNGQARILSNPMLLCRNGSPASFLAGGEIPIRLLSERVADVIFKPYGINLEVTATADRSQQVLLDIVIKISDINPNVSIDGLPGMVEHNLKTTVDMRYNETIVLGGLYQDRRQKHVSKTPLFGHIPILGELFKSRSFQKNRSEFLVTLTPRPARPHDNIQHTLTNRVRKIQSSSELFDYSIFD